MKKVNNISKIINNIGQQLEKAMQEIATTEVASIQANTPVLTGNLRKSITSTTPIKEGTKISIRIGSSVIYSAKVEFENRSYLRSTIKADTSNIMEIIKKYLQEV